MRIAYICDGGGRLGWGHVTRARAFAEAAGGHATIVVGRGYPEIEAWRRGLGIELCLEAWARHDLPLDMATLAFDAAIVDHYTVAADWIGELNSEVPVLLVDDWMRPDAPVDSIVNSNVGARPDDYPGSRAGLRLGPSYAMLRREILLSRPAVPIEQQTSRLLVTFGGSDPDGRTAQAVEALTRTAWYAGGGSISVVLGPSYAGSTPWDRWRRERSARLEVVRQPADFVKRCADADLVVCGASTTTYELSYLGRPFVPVALVDNQSRVAEEWSRELECSPLTVWNDGWTEQLASQVDCLLADHARRVRMAARVAGLVDGRGADRVLAAAEELIGRRAMGST